MITDTQPGAHASSGISYIAFLFKNCISIINDYFWVALSMKSSCNHVVVEPTKTYVRLWVKHKAGLLQRLTYSIRKWESFSPFLKYANKPPCWWDDNAERLDPKIIPLPSCQLQCVLSVCKASSLEVCVGIHVCKHLKVLSKFKTSVLHLFERHLNKIITTGDKIF